MDTQYLTYRSFDNIELAQQFIDVLKDNDIEYQFSEDAFSFDPGFRISGTIAPKFDVKIHPGDFEKVNAIFGSTVIEDQEIEPDYYLLSFSNDELKDVLKNQDEWDSYDVLLARKLLAERGIEVTKQQIDSYKVQRLEQLQRPEKSQMIWIIAGYLLIILGGLYSIFPQVLGMFIGWHLKSHKKTLPNGEQVYGYSETDKKHGQIIFTLSIIGLIIAMLRRLYLTGQANYTIG